MTNTSNLLAISGCLQAVQQHMMNCTVSRECSEGICEMVLGDEGAGGDT